MSNPEQTKTPPSAESPAPDASASSGAEVYARWLDGMQRSRTRHAAITRNLHTWSNYVDWAEKMRADWNSDQQKKR